MWNLENQTKYYDLSSGQLVGYNPHPNMPKTNNVPQKTPQIQQRPNSYSQAVNTSKNNKKTCTFSYYPN